MSLRLTSTLRPSRLPAPAAATAGVLLVRDGVDVVAVAVAHHLGIGVERIHVIDDGSSDGTGELLQALVAAASGRVSYEFVDGEQDPQSRVANAAANRLIAEGARLVVPFDADELWDLSPEALAALAADARPRRLMSGWVNFAQSRQETYPRAGGLEQVRYRVPSDPGVDYPEVSGFEASFLQYGPVPKCLVWSDEPVAFATGQHHVDRIDGSRPLPEEPLGADLLHVPVRWRSELTKRALNYEPRRAAQRQNAEESWQSAFHRRAFQESRVAEVWAAVSVDDDGALDVYGRRVPAVRDDRVRTAVRRARRHLHSLGVAWP